ncbi:acyltransferase family protein [Streptomyces sp. IBSBF 2435]|uniref:acyltransferase family protein n=1 Tax=Streptomyces sp. IBSBF 2435 TaxID=2903531 RepID=UPI002FDBF6AC
MTSRTPGQPLPEQAGPAPVREPQAAAPGGAKAKPVRLAAVDALRLVAALSVAAYHFLGTGTAQYWGTDPRDFARPLHQASMYGWLGVEAFFVISGFVICMSGWGRTPGQFAVSRLSRLYPAYWAALALIVLYRVLLAMRQGDASGIPDLRQIVGNLTMAPEQVGVHELNGVVWTLWVEARFYLLMAVVLAFGTTYHRMLGFCTAWLALAVVTRQMHVALLDQVVQSDCAGLFIAGIVLYLMYRFGRNLLLWTMLGLAWAYELVALHDRTYYHMRDTAGPKIAVSWPVCALLLTGFLALLALCAFGPLRRLQWRWMVTAGILTYPFYLVHLTLGTALGVNLTNHGPALGPWVNLLTTLAAMLVLSWLIHKLVEKPLGLAMRRGLAAGLNPPTARAEAAAAAAAKAKAEAEARSGAGAGSGSGSGSGAGAGSG